MLDTQLTLPVDVLNNGTLVNKIYNRYESIPNRTVYTGPGHTLLKKDTITFYKTSPKRAGNFNGVARTAIKVTQDETIPGYDATTSISSPLIFDLSFGIPVGVTTPTIKEVRQRVIAILDNDALMARLMEGLEV